MANIHIKREHHLDRDDARERLQGVADSLQEQLNADWSWQGDTLSFKRSGASGSVDVGEDYLEFDIKLSMLLSPLKGKIESTIHEELDKALG